MATKLSQLELHGNTCKLLVPQGGVVNYNDIIAKTNHLDAQGRMLFVQGWNEQVGSRVPDLIAEQKAPERTPEMDLAITANYAAYSAGYDAAVTILTEIWEANKAAKRIDVVIENVDGARGAFSVSANGNSQIVWDRASSALEESVHFTTIEAGKKNEVLEINGQSWRALEEDHESTGGATTFYKNVLSGTTLARAINQACVFHDHQDYDATSTSGALQVAADAIDSALSLGRSDLLSPDALRQASARISRSGGADSYFGGVGRTLNEAVAAEGQKIATLSSLVEFLRSEGFEISNNDHQLKDIDAAVRYMAQRLNEHDQQQDAEFASSKQRG
jgi:hypothetical protein